MFFGGVDGTIQTIDKLGLLATSSARIWQPSQSEGVGGSILGVQFDSLETGDRQQTDYKFEQRGTPIF